MSLPLRSYYACLGYRLSTGIEFEYAMRAGTTTAFSSGPFEPSDHECIEVPHLNDAAWYCINSGNRTHPVKGKKPNPWDLYDIMGNAEEFVASNPDEFEVGFEPQVDPGNLLSDAGVFGSSSGSYFGWPSLLRSGRLPFPVYAMHPDVDQRAIKAAAYGFRLVRTITEEEAAAW